jgi:predicted CoA-binding protein
VQPQDPIERFLLSRAYGVVGASSRRHKYGNKVLRCYQQAGRRAIPVNPREAEIEGLPCVASVLDLPDEVKSISVITPPAITERIVADAIARGIDNVWMQPGAESAASVEACREAGINVIADGSCVLVVLGYRERHEPGPAATQGAKRPV